MLGGLGAAPPRSERCAARPAREAMRSSSRNGYGVSAWGASTTRGIVQASGERAELAVPGSRERQARTIYRPPLNTNLAQSTLRQKKLRTENQARFLMNGVCHNQVTVKWSKEVWATPTTEEGSAIQRRASVQGPSIPPSRPQGRESSSRRDDREHARLAIPAHARLARYTPPSKLQPC